MRLTKKKILFTIAFALFMHFLTLQFDPNPPTDINDIEINLWLPFHFITTIILPIGFLLTLTLLPDSKFSRFMIKTGKKTKVLVLVFAGFYSIWLIGFSLMSNATNSFNEIYDKTGADSLVLHAIKQNEELKALVGGIDSTINYNTEISSFSAKYQTLVHGKNETKHIEILLTKNNEWYVDTLIIK